MEWEGRPQCLHIKANGERCGSRALTRSDLCYSHDPKVLERRRAANVAAGATRRRRKQWPGSR